MKKRFKVQAVQRMAAIRRMAGVAVLAAVIAFSMASCATTTIGAAHGDHGLISGLFNPASVTEDAQKIESYMVILGLVDVGFGDYAAKVKEAEASGKRITSVSRNYFGIVGINTAYAKQQ
jgi:uncharacterized membrane protein